MNQITKALVAPRRMDSGRVVEMTNRLVVGSITIWWINSMAELLMSWLVLSPKKQITVA